MVDPMSGVVLTFTTAASLGLLIGAIGRRLARAAGEFRAFSAVRSSHQTDARGTGRPADLVVNGRGT